MEDDRTLRDVDGVIADALKVGQGVQQLGHPGALLGGQRPVGELDQIVVQQTLQLVQRHLGFVEPLQLLGVKFPDELHSQPVVVPGELAHLHHRIVGPLQRQGGGGQETVVQHGQLPLLRVAGHHRLDQLDELAVEGKKQGSTGDVERQVEVGDRAHVHGVFPERKAEQGVARVQNHQKKDRADDVEKEVNHGGPLGIFGSAHRRDERGDAGADVLAHNQRHGDVEGNHAGGADGLEYAHRGGGALEQGGDRRSHGYAQKGIGEGGKHRLELRQILQRLHGGGHGVHADEQQAQAQHDLAHNALVPALDEHVEDDAHNRQNGPQEGGLQEHHHDVVRVDITQAQQLRGDGSADVGAHDDAHCLLQLHDARVDETDAHDGGGGGALDQPGDDGPQKDPFEYVAGKTLQDMLQPAAGELLQAVRHGGHTKQERGDGAKHGDYIRNIHNAPPNLTPRSNFRKILLISDHDKL